MDVKEFKQKYPDYADVPDSVLADRLHQKYYSDMPKDVFFQKFGVEVPKEEAPKEPSYADTVRKNAAEVEQQSAARKELFIGGATQAIKGMRAPLAALGQFISGQPNTPEENEFIRKQREEQAALDALAEKTPRSLGLQTAGGIAASIPLVLATGGTGPISAATNAATRSSPALAQLAATNTAVRAAPAIVEGAGVGYLAGKAAPTTAARTPNETPEQAFENYKKESASNATVGAVIGGAVPGAGALVESGLNTKVGGKIGDWLLSLMPGMKAARTGEAERRVASQLTERVGTTRPTNVTPQQLASEVEQGTAMTKAMNERYGTNITPTTAQASGDTAVAGYFRDKAEPIYMGTVARKAAGEAEAVVPAVKEQAVQKELGSLITQTRENLTEKQKAALPAVAQRIGENQPEYVLQKAGVKTSALTPDEIKALKGGKVTEQIDIADARASAEYDKIDPKGTIVLPSKDLRTDISDNVPTLLENKALTSKETAVFNDFLSKKTTTARDLVQLNADLSKTISRIDNSPAKTSLDADAVDYLRSLKAKINTTLETSPVPQVAEQARKARQLYQETQTVMYEQPGRGTGTVQSEAARQIESAKVSGMQVPIESIGDKAVRTPEAISDYLRGAEYTGGPKAAREARAGAREVLIKELKSSLGQNPTPQAVDKWLVTNKARVDAVSEKLLPEIQGIKQTIIETAKDRATASKLLGGESAMRTAVKQAVTKPDKMQELVDLASKEKTGSAIRGLRQLYQDEIENNLTATVQRTGAEQGGTTIAESTGKYIDDLADANSQARKSLQVLWGKDAQNIADAASLLKRYHVDRISTSKGADDVAANILEAAGAQASDLRTMTIGRVEQVIRSLTDREYRQVVSKAASDPEYAAKLLKAAREPKTNFSMELLRDAGITAGYLENTSDRQVNKRYKAPEAVLPQKKSENSVLDSAKEALSYLNPISSAEASTQIKLPSGGKIPYSKTYVDMIAKAKLDPEKKKIAEMAIAESVAQQWSPTKALNFIHAESTFKHNAKAGTSSAQGLMQLTDSAFKDAEKLAGRKLNRNSPRDNVTAGVIYAKSLEDRLEAATGKRPPEYLVYTAYHSGFGGAMKLLDPKNQTKPAAALLPDHAKANRAMYFNPNGRPYSIKKVRQNLKDYYEAKRLDK